MVCCLFKIISLFVEDVPDTDTDTNVACHGFVVSDDVPCNDVDNTNLFLVSIPLLLPPVQYSEM